MKNQETPKRFAMTGVGGFVAPKHLKAIKDTGNQLAVSLDKHDSVGIIDSYFPNSSFFTEYERFDRFLEKARIAGQPIDYVSVCSPNYLHDAHCRMALRVGADAICEKPLVINPWNLDQLVEIEQMYGKKVHTVLQLRHHPEVLKLKQQAEFESDRRDICLTYITRRGQWYHQSWKGDPSRSGGLAMNIGIHFFDFLAWIYGKPTRNLVHINEASRMSGVLELEKARVRWFLSVNESDLPKQVVQNGGYAHRSITIDGSEFDLSGGFADLHTTVYEGILDGAGFGVEDARPAIDMVHQICNTIPCPPKSTAHPFVSFGNTSNPVSVR